MSTMDFIARLRTKPLPVRRRIAIATSAAATALVGVLWVTASIALGTLPGFSTTVAEAPATNQLGAVAASGQAGNAPVAAPAAKGDPSLRIVDTKTTSTLSPQSDPTIIPF